MSLDGEGCEWIRVVEPTWEPLTIRQAKAQCRIDLEDEHALLDSYIRAARQAAEAQMSRGIPAQTWKLTLPDFAETIWLPMAAPLQDNGTAIPIISNSLANPTVVTTLVPHGFTTGNLVTIAGNVTSSPAINGAQTVTVLSPTTFSVVVNVTTAGTGGTVALTTPTTAPVVQYYDADGALQTLSRATYAVDTTSRPGSLRLASGQVWPNADGVEITYVVGWTSADLVPERIKQGCRLYVAAMDADRDGFTAGGYQAREAACACWDDIVFWKPPDYD